MVSNKKIAWLLSYLSIGTISATVITPALPSIQHFYSLGHGEVDWLVSGFLLGYVIGQLIYAPIANAWGRLVALRFGLGINLLGLIVCVLALVTHNFFELVIGRMLNGLGCAGSLVCAFILINEWLVLEQRRSAMACTIFSLIIGIGVAVLVGGVITEYWWWQGCFIVLLIHGIIMLIGVNVFDETLINATPINAHTILQGYRNALYCSRLTIYSFAVGFCSAIAYCFSAAAPLIAMNRLLITPAAYGYWNLLNILGMLIGGLLSKYLLNRIPALQVMITGFVLCFVGLLSLGLMTKIAAASCWWFFMSTLILYMSNGLIFSGASYVASDALADKANGSAVMSFINIFTATGAVMVMNKLSSNPLTAFTGILSLLWLVAIVLLIQHHRPVKTLV